MEEAPAKASRLWMILLALCAVALIGAAALIFLNQGDGGDDDEELGLLRLGWAVPDGEETVGSVILDVDPGDGGTNRLQVDVDPVDGSWLADIDVVGVELIPYRGEADTATLSLELEGSDQRGSSDFDFSGGDAWEIRVTSDEIRLATFFVLLPDPNLFGNERVELLPEDPEARALYERASEAVANWHRVRYEQQLSNGEGLAVVSFREVNDGSDGSEPGFRYVTPGGLEAYVIGTTAWSRYPGEAWDVRESNALIPPSEWGGEYEGATGFQLGPVTDGPDGPCRVITFVVPGGERQAIAWYAWCIDEESGMLVRDSMIARAHYMITEFSDFDGDVVLSPPIEAEVPPRGSPSPVAGVSSTTNER
ncbi:MAG: hypothetical protein AB7V46_10625 [Thermomicrobiales bacterium]